MPGHLDAIHAQRLLVVDDEPAICEAIAAVAEEAGYEVATTTEGGEFKRLYDTFRPTLICLDIIMPPPDGIELLRFLADRDCLAPVMIISGYHGVYIKNARTLAEAMGLHCLASLRKPVGIAELRHTFHLAMRWKTPEAAPPRPLWLAR